MNEPSTGDVKSPEERSAKPRKSAVRWRRKAVVVLIGAPVFLAVLTVGGFGLFTRIDARDSNPRDPLCGLYRQPVFSLLDGGHCA